MMRRLERGTFLRTAVATTAATLNLFYPGLTSAARMAGFDNRSSPETQPPPGVTVKQMTGPDPSFAGGEVVAKTADGVVVKSREIVRAVRIPVDTVIWKEFDVTPDTLQLGDWLDAKGIPLTDGSLRALSGWTFVNIGRRDGVVGHVDSPNSLTAEHDQNSYSMELSPRLEVISAEDGSILPGGLAQLTPGIPFGAVGLRLPNNGFRATRIWI